MATQVTNELLQTYFAGRATALQKQLIEEWTQQTDNRELFFARLATWESQNPQFIADTDQGLERHRQRMATQATPIEEIPTHMNPPVVGVRWLRPSWLTGLVAASVILVLGMVGWVYRDQFLYQTYSTAFGEIRTVRLADGSRVTLNAHSTLYVPRFGFGGQTREVKLTGEAEFSVQHMANHQRFVVKTPNGFDVVVLGTEFMVNTRERGAKVVLNKGKVRLNYQEGATRRQLTMRPGDLVTFDRRGHAALKQTPKPQNFTAWKEHRYVFEATKLAELASIFSENFGLQLQIPDPELAQWTISGAFTARNANELLETLAEASNLSYERQGDIIVIRQAN